MSEVGRAGGGAGRAEQDVDRKRGGVMEPRWALLVDLTGGNFPGARSVVVTGDWDATPDCIREMAAEHYGVALSKVALVRPDEFEAFLGGYEAVCDDDIDGTKVRISYEEWKAR